MAFNYAKEDVAKSAVVNVEDATTKIKELIIKGVNSGVAKEQILDDTKRIIAYCIKNIEHIKDKEIVMRSLWNNANQVLYEYTRAVKVFSTNAYNRAVDLGFMNDTYSYDGKVIDKIRNLIDSEKKDMINPIIEDYQKKIRSTIRVLSAEAPFAVETTPSGHTSKMGIRVRAEMKVRYEANMAELERYKTEGVKLVWITSHPNCSPRCKDYQGKLYSLDGTRGTINGIKYEPIEEALAGPYGDGNGCISGYNCRHRLVEYKEGSKAPIEYTEYEIKRAYAIDKQQRSIEGGIRQLKVEEKLLRASGNNAAAKVLRLKWQALTKEYEVFCLTNKRPISRWRCVVSKEELDNSNLTIDNDIDMNYNGVVVLTLGIKMLSVCDDLCTYAKHIKPIEGYQDIVCHSDEYGFCYKDRYGHETNITPAQLANDIRSTGKFVEGKPIRLLSCKAGKGGHPQILANILGVEIMAATEDVNVCIDGEFDIYSKIETTGAKTKGEWKIFYPMRGVK